MAWPTCWAVAVALAAVVWCPVQLRADQLCPTCSPPPASELLSSVSVQQHPHLHHNHHQPQLQAQPQLQHVSDTFYRIEAIKQQILSKLGLQAKPNVSSSIPHEVLLETMRIVDDTAGIQRKQQPQLELDDDDLGRASEIISFAEPGPRFNEQTLLEFSHSQENAGDLRIKSANLWVRMELRPGVLRGALSGAGPAQFHHHHHSPRHKNFSFFVFRANNVAASINATYPSSKDLELASSLDMSAEALGWLKFDITETVQEWYSGAASARHKLHLLVDCAGCSELVQQPLKGPGGGWRAQQPNHRPFLVVHTDPDVPKRTKRHALTCSDQVKQCCMQRFYVNFTQIGWSDWIIRPNGYEANYCRGTCGLHRTPDTFLNYHTHVMAQYRTRNRLAGLQPCCSPVKFSPISLIYFDRDNNIVKQDLPKMTVEECGCP